jgi:DNA (cytosine-5)-methyltransferase 1
VSAATLERPEVGYQHPSVPWNGLTVTDLFCGAGGSSSGLVAAGYRVVIAANHWDDALHDHKINHPETDHSSADLSQVNPGYFPRTDVLWGSPECTNHSVAKGVKRQRVEQAALLDIERLLSLGVPRSEALDMVAADALPDEAANRSRATMWDIPRFAEHHKYLAIIIENVVDAYKWVQFPAWLTAMDSLGYDHTIVWQNSMHAQAAGLPAPQSRDRMYIVFWRRSLQGKRKGGPDVQKWTRPRAYCEQHGMILAQKVFKKTEEWGRYRAQYVYRCPSCGADVEPGWLPALSAIDFSIPGERIGDKPLKEFWADKQKTQSLGFHHLAPKTEHRIERGIERHWKPLLVTAAGNTYDGINTGSSYLRAYPIDDPMPVQQTTVQHALVIPPLITDGIHGEGTVQSADGPMHTQTTAQTKGIAYAPFLAQFRERDRTFDPARQPLPTLVADGAGQGLIQHTAMLVPVEGRDGKSASRADRPMRTQSTRNETALVIPLRNHGVAKSAQLPIDTVSAEGNHHALVMTNNHENRTRTVDEPLPTATTANVHALLMRNNTARGDAGQMSTPVTEPMRALTTAGHQSLLVPYYGASEAARPTSEPHGTLPTVDRYALVESEFSLNLEDVIFRMLTPDEIKVGMAFARDYYLGGTKRAQVKKAGNAVCPPNARDLGFAVAEFLTGVEMERAA